MVAATADETTGLYCVVLCCVVFSVTDHTEPQSDRYNRLLMGSVEMLEMHTMLNVEEETELSLTQCFN